MVRISGSVGEAEGIESSFSILGSRAGQRVSLLAMAVAVALLTGAGWGILVLVVAPQRLSLGTAGIFGIGLGVTAYALGMRHAFDADHIAAIDNTTRKLLADGQRPLSVGFWFALGHSSVVFVLCVLLSAGARILVDQVAANDSALREFTGSAGALVSGVFLLVIGLVNLVVLRQIVAMFRGIRAGEFDEGDFAEQMHNRGLLARLLSPIMGAVKRPWHMYPVGVLFGLGFDTATEVSLLILAGGAAAVQLPWYAILCLPLLFAAGMTLFDTIDGCFMNVAYGWAYSRPVRKVYYNIIVTALSVVAALGIGSVELLGLVADRMGATTGVLGAIAGIDLNWLGCGLVLLFVLTWSAAIIGYRIGRVEERWSAPSRQIESLTRR